MEKRCVSCKFWINITGDQFGECHLNPDVIRKHCTDFCSHWKNKNEKQLLKD